MPEMLLDAVGRRRTPATMPEFHAGRSPRNKGQRYPADAERPEIVVVMRHAGDGLHGTRLRGLIIVLWRAGLRIHEALALSEPTWIRAADRCWFAAARAGADARSGWMSGAGSSFGLGLLLASSCRSVRCSASPPGRPADAAGHRRPRESSSVRPACADASRRISCATRTRSRSPAKASRSSSCSADSDTPTSGSPRSTCRAARDAARADGRAEADQQSPAPRCVRPSARSPPVAGHGAPRRGAPPRGR
jgi:hypothetical protein